MDYVLTTEGLRKTYRNFNALNGLSMHVPKGAIYGFVGRNGAGKTTLIRLACGLQFPTDGELALYGASYRDGAIHEARKRIGAVVETPSIFPAMTAEDNLRHQYRVLGLPNYDGIKELLELVGLADTGRKKAEQFSLGMRQRGRGAGRGCGRAASWCAGAPGPPRRAGRPPRFYDPRRADQRPRPAGNRRCARADPQAQP